MLLLPSFAAAILGGLGNPLGAIAGGYVIAFSEITITYAFKKVFVNLLPENLEPSGLVQLISTDYKFVVSYSILILVLLLVLRQNFAFLLFQSLVSFLNQI